MPGASSTVGRRFSGSASIRPTSHEKFIAKYHLPFPLLSDPDKKIVNDYGVWVEKSMYGKKYMGAERTTFVIDGQGRIAAILRKVKPAEHVDQLRAALASESCVCASAVFARTHLRAMTTMRCEAAHHRQKLRSAK